MKLIEDSTRREDSRGQPTGRESNSGLAHCPRYGDGTFVEL